MSELGRFQAAFAEALGGEAGGLTAWLPPEAEPRLAVYRNTVAKGLADAIAAQFPTVGTVVGEAWLRDAAVLFAAGHRPATASLSDYGADFAAWLAAFAPAAEMPWLAELARVDRARTEALFAADAPALSTAALAGLAIEDYAAQGLDLHPAARALWFESGVPDLWLALQAGPAAAELALEPQAILITRPDLEVHAQRLGRGAWALLQACGAGASLAAAGEAALTAQPDLDLAGAFAQLIKAGAFGNLRPRVS